MTATSVHQEKKNRFPHNDQTSPTTILNVIYYQLPVNFFFSLYTIEWNLKQRCSLASVLFYKLHLSTVDDVMSLKKYGRVKKLVN